MEILLKKLMQHNIRIDVVGGELELSIPENFDASEIIQEIKQNKAALVNFISNSTSQEGFLNIKTCPKKEYYALSSAQKRLYFLQTFEPTTTAYNMDDIYSVQEKLDKARISDAFNQLIVRHENLRTSFLMVEGEPKQKIHDTVDFEIEWFEGEEAAILEFRGRFFRPFDLSLAPLFRVAVIKHISPYKKGESESIILVDTHHIISDGLSHNILIQDIMALYRGQKLAPLALSYKDYAEWQQEEIQGENIGSHKKFWLSLYEEELSPLELPLDFPRPLIKDNAGSTLFFSLDNTQTQSLRNLSKQKGVTHFIILLSLIKILLYKLSNEKDIVVGTLTSGRFHLDLERIIGMLVNTVALKTHIDPQKPYSQFIQELQSQTYLSFEHHAYPYEELVNDLGIKRDPGRNPLFEVMFSFFDEYETPVLQHSKKSQANVENSLPLDHNHSTFDLYITARVKSDRINFECDYSRSLFKADTINRFVAYLKNIISEVSLYPNIPLHQINVLSLQEKDQLLYDFNDHYRSLPSSCSFSELWQESLVHNSQRMAVEHNGLSLSYRELDYKSYKLAAYLHENGVKRGSRVVLFMPRSIETLYSMLAIFHLGAAYIPIDVYNPLHRVKEIIQDSESLVVLSSQAYTSQLENIADEISDKLSIVSVDQLDLSVYEETILPAIDYHPDDLAYIIYTSGSTGKPKGVMIHQAGMINHLFAKIDDLQIDEHEVIAQTASPGFDISVWQFLAALLKGGKTYIIDKEQVLNPDSLLAKLEEGEVSIFESVPSLMGAFLTRVTEKHRTSLSSLKWMLATGEPLSINLSKKWYACFPDIPLVNAYGPTEASDDITHHIVEFPRDENLIPVGKPIQNMHIYIMDDFLNLCPVGVKGQICVSGIGVGLGYWNNEKKTEQAFVENPFAANFKDLSHRKLYKTGDAGYLLADGTLICEGRIDEQVKILGNRIELGEIEERLLQYPSIQEVAVLAKSDDNSTYLVSYYVATEELDIQKIRQFLLEQIPDYMVPHYYVALAEMPTTSSGKLDRKALPLPEIKATKDYIAPSNETETKLVQIWAEVLNLEEHQISTNSNFFGLGGHSLRAVFMTIKIAEIFNIQVSLRNIFAYQDIQSLAKVIIESPELEENPGKLNAAAIEPVEKREYYPLSSAQMRIFLTQKLIKNSQALHIYEEFTVEKEYDLPRLKHIFQQIIQRHESLRTSIKIIDNTPVQVIHDEVEFEIMEISEEAWITGDFAYNASFNLEEAPLMHIGLIIGKENNRLVVDMHHIISDGFSNAILLKEFQKLAKGEVLPELKIQYKDYAIWQRKELQSGILQHQESYWLNIFNGKIPKLNLPGDQTPLQPLKQIGASLNFQIGGDTYKKIKEISQGNKVPLFSVLMTLKTIVLHKLAAQDDIIIGVPTAGRNHLHLEKVIGMFLNTIALRLFPQKAKRFSAFLKEVASSMTEALDNQDYQFDELVEKLKLTRENWKNPLFNVIMVIQNHLDEEDFTQDEIEGIEVVGRNDQIPIINDLFFSYVESSHKINGNVQFNSGLYTEDLMRKVLAYFKEVIDAVSQKPEISLREIQLSHSLEEAEELALDDSFNF